MDPSEGMLASLREELLAIVVTMVKDDNDGCIVISLVMLVLFVSGNTEGSLSAFLDVMSVLHLRYERIKATKALASSLVVWHC